MGGEALNVIILQKAHWSWWLRNRPGPEGSLGWPPATATNA